MGEDGSRAKTSLELRDYTEHYYHRPPACRDDINGAHAAIISGGRECFSKIAQKPTWDFPKGGKCAKKFVKPDFFETVNVPQRVSHITPHPKRLEPIVRNDTDLKKIWSDGRDREISNVAKRMAGTRSVIDSFNEPINQGPAHFGKRIGEDVVRKDVPRDHFVKGFSGVGNRYEGQANPRPNRDLAIKTNAVPFNETKFMGRRKSDWNM